MNRSLFVALISSMFLAFGDPISVSAQSETGDDSTTTSEIDEIKWQKEREINIATLQAQRIPEYEYQLSVYIESLKSSNFEIQKLQLKIANTIYPQFIRSYKSILDIRNSKRSRTIEDIFNLKLKLLKGDEKNLIKLNQIYFRCGGDDLNLKKSNCIKPKKLMDELDPNFGVMEMQKEEDSKKSAKTMGAIDADTEAKNYEDTENKSEYNSIESFHPIEESRRNFYFRQRMADKLPEFITQKNNKKKNNKISVNIDIN